MLAEVIEINRHIELQLGIAGGICDDGRDPVLFGVLYPKDLADRVCRSEIFLCGGGGENDIVKPSESIGVACEQREGKDPEEGRVCV